MSFHSLIAHLLIFLALKNIPFCGCISLFTHLPTEGGVGCFQLLVIMNKTDRNFVGRFLCGYKFSSPLGKSRGKLAGLYKNVLTFIRNHYTVFKGEILWNQVFVKVFWPSFGQNFCEILTILWNPVLTDQFQNRNHICYLKWPACLSLA